MDIYIYIYNWKIAALGVRLVGRVVKPQPSTCGRRPACNGKILKSEIIEI